MRKIIKVKQSMRKGKVVKAHTRIIDATSAPIKPTKVAGISKAILDDMDTYNISYAEAKAHADAISKATGMTIKPAHYVGWMSGGKGYAKFDAAAKKLLGESNHQKYDVLARLAARVSYKLGLSKNKYAGGINVSLDDKPAKKSKPKKKVGYGM